MQPRWRPAGTYGCIRRYRPARTGGTHENVPQPRVVDRAAGRGSGRLGHRHRAGGRDRPSPCPGAARRHGIRPAAALALAVGQPGTVTNAQALAQRDTDAGTITIAGIITDARALTITRA
jgi:hypothetical protein